MDEDGHLETEMDEGKYYEDQHTTFHSITLTGARICIHLRSFNVSPSPYSKLP
jgi:hypothetical protein